MTIYQLECFIAVAEELNFSAAAQRLFTTQPAVTYQINTLEKETGLHLFDRTTRRTKLTAAGQSFYLDMVQMTSFGRQALKRPRISRPQTGPIWWWGCGSSLITAPLPASWQSTSGSTPMPRWK